MLNWPTESNSKLAVYALDQHMVGHFDGQPSGVVRQYQHHHLKQLIQHSVDRSLWWRERFASADRDRRFVFADLPVLTRDAYRESVAAARGSLPLPAWQGQVSENATSGSSGVPVKFYVSAMSIRMNNAHYRFDRTRHRFNAERSVARVGTAIKPHDGQHVHVPAVPLLGINEEFQRRSKQFTIESHARWISSIQPGYLLAATSLLIGILDSYEEGVVAPPLRKPEAILSFAETVTPQFREQAMRVLKARVLDRYSCEEVGPIAFQCPRDDAHYHIAATNVFVEVLDDAGGPAASGTIGRVVVTSLHNWASPVIRYELGDLAAMAPRCVCGHDGPVLTQLLGRKRFLIRLPNGERQYVLVNAKNWLSVAPVREARVVQVSEGVIHAECVLDRPLTTLEKKNMLSMLRHEISPDFTYLIHELDCIDWGSTYKRQDVISLI